MLTNADPFKYNVVFKNAVLRQRLGTDADNTFDVFGVSGTGLAALSDCVYMDFSMIRC